MKKARQRNVTNWCCEKVSTIPSPSSLPSSGSQHNRDLSDQTKESRDARDSGDACKVSENQPESVEGGFAETSAPDARLHVSVEIDVPDQQKKECASTKHLT